jgi:hypothetical protein
MRLLRTYSKNFISCFVLLLLIQTNVQSQSQGNKFWPQKKWFIGVSGGPAQTNISFDGTSVISAAVAAKEVSYCLSVDAGYWFSKCFGFSTGIGLSPYLSQLSLDTYANSLDTIDSENENYERRISGNSISETQKIYFLEIPVSLIFQYPFSKSIGFYLQGGINLAIHVGNNYSSSGTFSYSGYYPAYNVVLEDIPYEGFKSNVKNDVSGELKVKTLNPELTTSGGLYFNNQKHFQISVGFFYKSFFSDISEYAAVETFQLSTHEDQLRSLMEGSQKTTASSMGILISLRYYLK